MRLPRDLSGRELAALLERQGYRFSRQTGSHIRLIYSAGGIEHHVTVPAHSPLKIGTLSGIVSDVARAIGISREELAEQLFRK